MSCSRVSIREAATGEHDIANLQGHTFFARCPALYEHEHEPFGVTSNAWGASKLSPNLRYEKGLENQNRAYTILYYKIQYVCVSVCVWVCEYVSMWVCESGIGSQIMRTTVMEFLQVTQWV